MVVGDRCVQRDHVSLGEQLVEAVAGLVVVRVGRDDGHAQPGQPPFQCPADGAETHESGRAPGDLPGAEPLIRDGAVAEHLACPHLPVGRHHVAGGGEQKCERHLGNRVGIAGRRVQHRNARRRRTGHVDVVRVAAGGGDCPQSEVEHRTSNRITLHDNNIGGFCTDPLGELLGAVDPQRGLVDPRVVDDVGELPQLVQAGTAQRRGHQCAKSGHVCTCWRTVTPVSRGSAANDVTIGIDIGTTAVKAVAADEHGRVIARARVPHQVRVPEPDRLEHDADEAWRRGPVGGDAAPGSARRAGGRRLGDGAVADRGRFRWSADHAGPAVRRRPGPAVKPAAGELLTGEMTEFLRWTAREAPDAAGYWPAPAVANYALAGEAVIDVATAGTAYPLFDGTGWSERSCAELGVSVDRMPRVEMIGAAIGQVFGTDTVLAAGAIDALCEQLVAGADNDGDVLVVCGTTLIVWATTPEPNQVPGLWTIPHTSAGKSQIGGASNAGGLFLNWVDRLVGQGNTSASDPRRVPVWSPYVRGERTPLHDPDRRAVLDGLDLTHDAASLRRAAFEASAFVVRQLIELSGVSVSAHRRDRRGHPARAVDAARSPTRRACRWRCRAWRRGRRWGRLSSREWP